MPPHADERRARKARASRRVHGFVTRGARALLGLALASAALATATARADYSPPAIEDLVLASDAIVTGRIVALGPDTFTLDVREVVAGTASARIEVRRFADWTCAARWAPYAAGQEVLLFLDRGDRGLFEIRSAGGEGEMPIDRGRVLVPSFYDELAPAGSDAHAVHAVHGGRFVGTSAPQAELLDALRAARACFSVVRGGAPYRRVLAVQQTCADPALRAASATPIGASLLPALSRRVRAR